MREASKARRKQLSKGVRELRSMDEEGVMDHIEAQMQSQVEGVAVEEAVRQSASWPIFVLVQATITLTLWTVFAFQNQRWGTITRAVGGLESFFPGYTTMILHKDCVDHRMEIWRWWTYQFTHNKFSHIATNIFIIIVAGIPLEGFQGSLRVFLKFNAGVLAAAAGHMISNPHAGSSPLLDEDGQAVVGLVGMSGGCYAILGVHMANLMVNWYQIRFRKPILLILLLLIGIDLAQVQLDLKRGGMVAHSAHFGGYIAGLLMGVTIGRSMRDDAAWKYVCAKRLLASLIGAALVGACLIWYGHWPPRSMHDMTPWCFARQVNNFSVFGDYEYHCIRCQDAECAERWLQQRFIEPVDYNICRRNEIWEITER
mmetsp:Transcript_87451/g.265326  ORF Transcript_87451/g.265326 Transcript_87451/m.265326 type:complete len:370 (-) Transcript_87451:72-1181(-)